MSLILLSSGQALSFPQASSHFRIQGPAQLALSWRMGEGAGGGAQPTAEIRVKSSGGETKSSIFILNVLHLQGPVGVPLGAVWVSSDRSPLQLGWGWAWGFFSARHCGTTPVKRGIRRDGEARPLIPGDWGTKLMLLHKESSKCQSNSLVK